MKFAGKVLLLVGYFVLGFLLFYAQALVQPNALIGENAASLNLERLPMPSEHQQNIV